MTQTVSREQVIRYRIRASHLDAKLPPGSFAKAAWGGLQDSVPRGGVISLHARVEGTQPNSWEDPSVAQIWFRGGADYIVPRADVGVFTLGSLPRAPGAAARLEGLADEIHRVAEGRTLKVREVQELLGAGHPTAVRFAAPTGRILIRWDARDIWLIPIERPDIDPERARLELARRFVHWFGPTTRAAMARWTGVTNSDATTTWRGIEKDLVPVELDGAERHVLASDVDALLRAAPVEGIRLLPFDDALTKLDRELLVRDPDIRRRVIPPAGTSLGYIPGAILADGELVGAWQRQQRRVRIHPTQRLSAAVRKAVEREARTFPIAGAAEPTVSWD